MDWQTWFDVVPEGRFWVVRCRSIEHGRFPSQMAAFNAAVAEARKMKEEGRVAHVRVLHGGVPKEAIF